MRDARERFRSGECRITGEVDYGDGTGGLSGPIEIYLVFDGDANLRFDRSEKGWLPDPALTEPDPALPGKVNVKGLLQGQVKRHYAKNPSKEANWIDGTSEILLNAPGAAPPSDVGYLDVRALGLYHWLAFQRHSTFTDLINGYSRIKGLSVVQNGGLWSLTWENTDALFVNRSRLDVDTDHGFTPTRFELTETSRKIAGDRGRLTQRTATQWKEVDGAYVPVKAEIVVDQSEKVKPQSYHFTLEWKSVNKAIPADLFTYTSFPAPDAVGVVDYSLGNPVVVKQYKSPPVKWVRPKPTKMTVTQRAVVTGAVTATLAVVAVVLYRRRRTTKAV